MSRHRAPPARDAGGYTLIEVIVAFAVLALGMTLLLGTLSNATRQVRWADEAGRAALHAQSLLDQAGVGETLEPGAREGQFERGRFHWRLAIEPYVDPTARAQPIVDPIEPTLLQLTLDVRWGEGARERLQVRTLRLVQPDLLKAIPQ